MDYVVGPGDTFNVQLYGTDNQRYKLTVARDGRVNFPKLGPIAVGGMSFDAARDLIEQRGHRGVIGAGSWPEPAGRWWRWCQSLGPSSWSFAGSTQANAPDRGGSSPRHL